MKKTKFGCSRCDYVERGEVNMEMKESAKEKLGIAIIDEKEENTNPVVAHECRRCGNKKAYFWIQQMRAGDEAESKFYQCTKCDVVERVE